MSTITKQLAVVASTVALMLTAAACGSDDDGGDNGSDDKAKAAAKAFAAQTAEEITSQTSDAMKGLKSMRLRGSLTEEDGKLELDLTVDTDGNCSGSISLGEGTAQIVVAEGDQYMKGNEQFWIASLDEERGPQMNDLIGDRWVQLPSEASDFSEFCDLDEFLDELDDADADEVTKGEVVDTDAGEAIEMISKEDGGTTTVRVATSEPHYILEASNDGDEPGSFTFSEFDEPVDPDVPDESDVVDMADLSGS